MDFDDIKLKRDIKPILEAIENLSPWDKNALIGYLYDKLPDESIENLLREYGYVDEASIDPVKMVEDEGLETDVLSGMSNWELADYVLNDSDILFYVFRDVDTKELVNTLVNNKLLCSDNEYWFDKFYEIFNNLRDKCPEEYYKWKKKKEGN